MELVGMAVPGGDLRAMAECLVEEYLLMGWDERQVMLLFTRPCFRATHRIYRDKGEGEGVGALADPGGSRQVGAGFKP